LELLIIQLKLQRYVVVLDFLMLKFKIIIMCLLQRLWPVLLWSFHILNCKLTINGNTSFKNKALETGLTHLLISHIHFKWRYRVITVVWFDLFVHPFSHICNIGHVNYRLQFSTHFQFSIFKFVTTSRFMCIYINIPKS
jgi:hypothetical protein